MRASASQPQKLASERGKALATRGAKGPVGWGAPKNTPQNISLILLGRFVNAQANCDIWPFTIKNT